MRCLAAFLTIGFVLATGSEALAQPTVFAIDVRIGTPSSLRTWPVTATDVSQVTTVSSTASFDGFAMDFNSAATTLFGITGPSPAVPVSTFGTIDPATGNFTAIVPVTGFTVATSFAGGLKIDPTNETFFVNDGGNLYTLNTTTGVLTTVGAFGGGVTMVDIAIDTAGNMFGLDIVSDSLFSINKATGAATLIGPTGFATNFAQGMDFDYSTNTLYATMYQGAGVGQFASLDTTTGVATSIFFTTSLNAEMEMAINAPVPEPASLALVGIGAIGLGVRRWRKKK